MNINTRLLEKEIDAYGDSIVIRPVSSEGYTKWGDNIEIQGTSSISYTTGDDTSNNVYGTTWIAQTFTVGSSAISAMNVRLKVYRVGSPGTITVSIKAVDVNGLPTGSDLTSETLSGDNLTTSTSGEWRSFEIDAYSLTASTKYAIVVRATTGTSSNKLCLLSDDSSPTYTSGSMINSSDSGSTWTASTGKDLMFNVYAELTSTKSMIQVLTQKDEQVKDGIFRSGDKIFWFKSSESNVSRGNKIYHDSKWYLIDTIDEHSTGDTKFVYEVVARKI